MSNFYIKLFTILTMILLIANSKVIAEEVNIATITDLKGIFTELKKTFEEENPDIVVNLIIGKEPELIKILEKPDSQINMLVLDSKDTIESLVKRNLIKKSSIKILAKDSLCVVVKKSIAMRAFMLYPKTPVVKAIAVCNPNQTALGRYTREALSNLNIWKKAAKKIVFFETNQLIAKTVARGQYDGGVMYCSFAKNSFVRITDYLNNKLHKPILYVSGISKRIKSNSAAYKFNNFLISPKAKNIMLKHHFSF